MIDPGESFDRSSKFAQENRTNEETDDLDARPFAGFHNGGLNVRAGNAEKGRYEKGQKEERKEKGRDAQERWWQVTGPASGDDFGAAEPVHGNGVTALSCTFALLPNLDFKGTCKANGKQNRSNASGLTGWPS